MNKRAPAATPRPTAHWLILIALGLVLLSGLAILGAGFAKTASVRLFFRITSGTFFAVAFLLGVLAALVRSVRRVRRLRFTREGRYFVMLTLGIGFAAINTANNLLYLIFGMMLGLIIVSGVISENTLRALVVKRVCPPRIHAATKALFSAKISCNKRFPSFSVEVQDLAGEAPIGKPSYFIKIASGADEEGFYTHLFPERGAIRLSGFALTTRFPFGLFEKTRLIDAPHDVVVYPRTHPVAAGSRSGLAEQSARHARPGSRGEFHALREYRDDDDPREIAWRKSAGTDRLLLQIRERPTGGRVTVYLNNSKGPLSATKDRQEALVSHAASLAVAHCREGSRVALRSHSLCVPFGSGPSHMHRILRVLALIDFVDTADLAADLTTPHKAAS